VVSEGKLSWVAPDDLSPVDPVGGLRAALRPARRVAALVAGSWRAQREVSALRRLEPAARARAGAELLSSVADDVLRAHGIETQLVGLVPTTPALVVSNHVGYLDPLIVGRVIPALPLAKVETLAWPVVGPAMTAFGCVFVDRGQPASGAAAIRSMTRRLAGGASMLVFPEGTTTPGDRLLPFFVGAFEAARRAGVPVVPLALTLPEPSLAWVGDDAFVPHYLGTTRRPRTRLTLTIGAMIPSSGAPSAGALAAEARAAIAALAKIPLQEDLR
jgi:1-acyl-sn-glycerol-3-phosphate acyltransferase